MCEKSNSFIDEEGTKEVYLVISGDTAILGADVVDADVVELGLVVVGGGGELVSTRLGFEKSSFGKSLK